MELARRELGAAKRAGKTTHYTQRSKPLNVRGVGPEGAECTHNLSLPIALQKADGSGVTAGSFVTPTIPGSDVPGLLGLGSLRKNRAILDCNTLQIHFCGPEEYDLEKMLPRGTETCALEVAPSGHLVLPCCEYPKDAAKSSSKSATPVAMLSHQGVLRPRHSKWSE